MSKLTLATISFLVGWTLARLDARYGSDAGLAVGLWLRSLVGY